MQTKGKSSETKEFDGLIIGEKEMVRRLNSHTKRIAELEAKHGIGGMNIDANRIPYENTEDKEGRRLGVIFDGQDQPATDWNRKSGFSTYNSDDYYSEKGRFPANVFRTEPFLDGLDKFFLIPKAAGGEKNHELEHLVEKPAEERNMFGGLVDENGKSKAGNARANIHPTVKPVALMDRLINLFIPHEVRDDCLILDPFMGSGTTLVAAKRFGVNAIGIEREEEYFKIAEARVKGKQTMLLPFELEVRT